MQLATEEAQRFYAAWRPLLSWVNEERQVIPDLPPLSEEHPVPITQAVAIRDVLWSDDALRESFVARNPAGLDRGLLDMIASWRHRKEGRFQILKHYKKHTVFLGDHDEAFAVLGLLSPLDEVLPMPPPVLVRAVLLPFGERIITDGLIVSYAISFGPNHRRGLLETWRHIRERRALRTSLLPQSPEQQQAHARQAQAGTNRDVLRAFRRHLLQKGLSERIVARDAATASALADVIPDGTLRDCDEQDFNVLLQPLSSAQQKTTRTGLKRLVQFLRDTHRMEWANAEELRRWFRTQSG